jgi:hypothetical protein
MAVDHIRYDILTQEAMRGVIRSVLVDAAARGLPGEHYFFITFDTKAEGVKISPRLRAQYPEEMTVVLQHQFWDLNVTDEAFGVGLSFNGVAEMLTVPFLAIKRFEDRAVHFMLSFADLVSTGVAEPAEKPAKRPAAIAKEQEPAVETLPAPAAATANPLETEKTGGAEVVRLDRFRKK